jgi:hypothetical protein
MKTKLTFFCTHCQYGGFEKVIFETVLDGNPFESTYDAREWVDSKISKFCDKFDFELVFEWVVINFEETDEDIKPVEIKKTLTGSLVFKGDKIQKIKAKKSTEAKQELKRQYDSMWIDPFGKSYVVGIAQHNNFASEWLFDNDKESYETSYHNTYPYCVLQDKGWVRILGWTRTPSIILPIKIGPKLKTAVKDYCISNGIDIPERLKS